MNQDDHDKITQIGVDVEYIKGSVDKLTLFMGAAPCSANTRRLDKIEQKVTWTVRTLIATVIGIIGFAIKKMTGF